MLRLLAAFALLTTTFAGPGPAAADVPCRTAQARSSNGAVQVMSSGYGCRTAGPLVMSVRGGVRDYEFPLGRNFPRAVHVSDTGRTVLLTDWEPSGDGSLIAYRDGQLLGTWTYAELLGERHRVVTRAQRIRVEVVGVRLVLKTRGGRTLLDEHLGLFAPRAAEAT